MIHAAAFLARRAAVIAAWVGPEGRGWVARLPIVEGLVGLSRLSFIHKARFVILPRRGFSRRERGQPRENLRYNHLMFLSNFTTNWDPYIDDIAAAVPSILDGIWGWAEGYKRAKDGPFDEFKAYIRRIQFDTDYYFAAYREASTSDVRAALRLTRALREFRGRPVEGPGEFEGAYLGLLEAVQGDLATTGRPGHRPVVDGPRPLRGSRKRGVVALCPLCPDKAGEVSNREQLRAFLAGQSEQDQGPLSALGGVHFARFVVIEEVSREGRERPRERLTSAYLLYASEFDGHLRDHLGRLFDRAQEFVRGAWKHCRGLSPGFDRGSFLKYIRRHRVRPLFRIEDAPGVSVGEIQRALEVQREFIRFLARTQGRPMPKVEAAFSAFALAKLDGGGR